MDWGPLFGKKRRLELEFERFHARNPHVYIILRDYSLRMFRKGRTRYSIRTIYHVVRWHYDIRTEQVDEFKLNDHWTPYYARMLMENESELEGFFETRELKS